METSFLGRAVDKIGQAVKRCGAKTEDERQQGIEATLLIAAVQFCVTNRLSPEMATTFAEAAYNAMRSIAITLD